MTTKTALLDFKIASKEDNVLTLSLDKTFVANNPQNEWLIGNARLVSFSGLLLGAHLAHAGLILLWAGSFTLLEVSQVQLGIPLGEQHLTLLPHLAVLGLGISEGGIVTDTYPYFVIGALHLISSAVIAAGGMFHILCGPSKLESGVGIVPKFSYDWHDDRQLTLILGHHLIFLGLGALGLCFKAIYWGGRETPSRQINSIDSFRNWGGSVALPRFHLDFWRGAPLTPQ
jgi:photosystem II CP43 chlorophyll apoprotein